MTHRLLRNIAALLVLVFFVECLPTAFLGEQIFLLHSNAEAEAVKQQGDKVADEQAATFSAIVDVARSRMLTDQISNDGEWQYLVLPEYGYAVITGHTDQGTQAVTVPDVLGGADVVAMLENVFAGHSRLCDVTFSTNLYAVAEGALPRGVTVNGYHGSYAQRWATQYGHPFANLSALDFVAGVIDCSDMDSSHFVRKSSTEVTMRSLEASRLQVGSVFFLPDPDDLYAVAYYRVAVRENAENDMVTFTCVTPGASEVVNSFTFDNAPLKPDWDTFQLADGVDTTVDEVRRLSASESNTVSFPYLNFEKKIGDYKITAGVTPSYTYKLSGEYSHFELQEASITETNSTKFYFKVSEKQAAYSYDEENEEKPSDIVKKMIKEARENKEKLKEKVETSQKLSTVVLFSWWGLVSVTFDISLNIEFSGSFEVNYTASTVTKYTYHDGTLSSSSTSSKKSITGSMKAEIKAGLFISLNLYVLNAEVFGFGAFVGLKTSASMKWETVLSEHKTTEDAITKALSEKTSDADITGNWMNMLDCISIKINFVLEVEAKLFKKPIWSKSILDLEIAHWHWHFSPFYYTDYPISVKVKEDISKAFHDEDNCPYTDAVYLLLPELDKRDTRSAAFKSITLGAQGNAVDLPVLDLPSYGKRVTYWYRDYALTDKYMIGEAGHVRYTTKAGEKFYGKTEDIGTIELVDGRLNVLLTDPSVKTENVSFGTETTVSEQAAWRCVESGNTLNTKSLKLARESHIIGWREAIPVTVSAPFPSTVPDLFPKYGDLIPHDKTNGTIFTSNGKKNQTYVAICDDDFTITFISPKGETSTITKGFMEEVQADEVPQFAYDPALWEIRWITESDSDVSFPITVTKDITLRASKRYIGTDHADTVIGVYPSTGIPSPVSDILLFNYSANEDGIVITGLSALGSVQTSLSIPAQVNGMPVVSVKAGAFKGNTNLIYVRLPATVKTIGSSAFEGCTALQVLDLAACSSLSSIPSRFAYGDTALRYVSIANGMTEIEDYAFYGCTSLSGKAVINASVGYGAFYNCKGMTELELHYMCEYVDSSAFSGCTALNETSIPESVMRIGSSAFKDCSVLISVEVPSSVTSIGGNAFSGCDNLESITLPFIGTSEGSIDRAFRKIFNNGENDGSSQYYGKGVPKKLKTVTITSATSIPDHAFAGCENIETIRINDGDMDIEDLAFYNCTSLKNLTLPTRTTKIGIEAFAGCVSLEEVSISKNVLEIGQYAFSGCSRLKEIRLPNGLLTIGSVAFKNCSALTSVEVPSSVTSIGGSAFSGCDDLESITLPFIGTSEGNSNRAFRRIFNSEQTDSSSQYYGKGVPEKLKTVTITNATSIPDHAFAGCNNIETIRINDGDMNIGNLAFYNCTSLKNLTLPTRTTKIGNEAFEGCASLEEVSISKNVLEIGQNAFSGCSGLKEIRLPNGLMTIGSSAFKNCSALTSVEVPSSVTSIGGNAFSGCDNLESITLPFIGTSEGSGNRAFRKIFNNAENDSYAYYYGKGVPEKLKKVTITNATSIPAYAFAGCTGIQKIVVLGTTTSIGAQAFEKCSSLQVLQLPNTILSVSSNAFAYCISLENLQLPAMLTSLPTNAFTGCTALPKATDEARDGGITSHLYNEVIANAASATGLRYTALQGTQDRYALTLIDGEQVLYSDILETGDDLTDTLSAYRPKDKEENGLHMTFYGWSLDGETYLPWRPTVMPHESLTLSAYFVPVQEATFACVLRGETIYSETVQAGVGLSVPKAEVPDMTGYVFDGWFLDDDFVTPFTSGTKMPENGLMVYGKMYPIPATMAFTKANDGMTLTRYMPATVADSSVSIPAYYNGVPVKAIAPEAFDYGSSIRVLIIPETVSSISEDALRGLTNLYSIQVHSDNKDFVSESGVLFTADKQTLLRYPASREASSYQVPEGTKTIAANAFTGAGKLKTIELADSVSVLGDYAFYDCSAITSFTANGLTKIGSSALPNGNCSFYGPVKTGVLREKLLLSEKYGVPMFTSPYNLYPLNLYQNGSLIVQYSLEAGSLIPDAFLYENDSQIYAWYKDAAMTEQWAYTEQMPQEALSLYGATEQVITYEHATFGEDESIEGIRLTAYHGRGGNIILPETLDGLDVMALGEGFLAGTHGPVQSVAIGNQVIEIASDALAGSEAYPFTGSIIADADSFVAAWAAENGYQLNARTYTLSFAVQGGAKLNDRVLAAGAEILLPVPVKEGNVFMGWYLDETLVTPTELEDGLYIMPRSAQTLYAAWEGEETVYPFTFEEAASSIVVTGISAKGEETTELVIPETINGLPVTEIAAEAFVNAKITSVSLPESMQRIGDRAFAGTPIQTAALGGTRIMGSGVFANCTELAALEMPKMETIGEGAFACCESLKVFPVPSGLVDFHPEVIKGCIGLEAFAVAADHPVYTEIDGMLVKKPMLLVSYPAGKLASSFVLPDGITMIGEEAFLGAWYLRDVTLTEDLISLGRFAFAECPELTDVTFADDSIEIIPEGCFSGSSRLNVLRLPDHLLEIGSRAFFGCDRLGTVDIADTVETIGSLAFAGDYVTLEGAYGLTAWQFAQDNDLRFIVNGGTQVTRLEIQMNTDNMHPGDIRAMTVQIEPEDAILGGEIAWYTSDAGIAFVYDHELHILSAGEVTVYAVAPNGVSAALPLDIYVAPESLSLDYTERLLLVGNSMNLKGTVLPFDTTDPTLVWMSSDPEIVQVSNTGKITANAVGVCDITASAVNGISAVCRVYVTSVAPSCATPVIYTGQRVCLELKGDVDLSGLPVSSESNYESVSTDGLLLEGVKAGEATVTISLGGYTMSVPVKVKQQPDSFALPRGLEVIEEEAFLGIPAVYVIIPQGTVSIEALAFAQMTSLEQIVIPASVTSIADNALEGSSQATLVVYPGTAGETYAQEHQMNYLLMAE
ncbi:MAG: leucine-rich repeat protein [Clostridia bacterium]|nr:leucine-rich repeat protein [Clostridia bacterium]